MKAKQLHLLTALALGFMCSCQSPNKSVNSSVSNTTNPNDVKPFHKPFAKLELTPNLFRINTLETTTLQLDNGTTIHIPENVFVDAQGQAITGEVELKYTEFHDAVDIICSGIPMRWDNAGTPVDFQTAGMMEIRAFQNNQELMIANGKSITVDMATYESDEDYDVFYYDEKIANWACLKDPIIKENTNKKEQLKALEADPPFNRTVPQAYDPNAYTFDIDINYQKFPELKDLNGVMWQYAGKSAKEDPRNVPDFKLKKWANIEIEKVNKEENEFKLKLTDSKKNTFYTTAKPVLRGKMLEMAQQNFNEQFERYKRKLELKKAEKARLEKQAELFRTFQVDNLGIYNYDRQLKLKDRIELFADFNFDEKAFADVNKIDVFLITGNNKAVVHYPQYNWKLFAYSPSADNKLVAVLPNDKIAVYTQKMFNAINTNSFTKNDRSHFTFDMKILDVPIGDPDKLREILAKI